MQVPTYLLRVLSFHRLFSVFDRAANPRHRRRERLSCKLVIWHVGRYFAANSGLSTLGSGTMRQGPTNSTPESRSRPKSPRGADAPRAGIRLLDCGDDTAVPGTSLSGPSAKEGADVGLSDPPSPGEQRHSV